MAVELKLHAKQALIFRSKATEILWGGAAGGGKSHVLRALAIAASLGARGVQTYLFRRTYPELIDTHVEGPMGFRAMLAPWIDSGSCQAKNNFTTIFFPATGSRIRLTYARRMEDVQRLLSAEIHLLLIDELTQIDEQVYRFLRSRVRAVGLGDGPLRWMLPRIVTGTNPIGKGLGWVKSTFYDPSPAMRPFRAEPSDGGLLRQFIPALPRDNPHLLRDDPGFYDRVRGLGNPALVAAMLEGDWTQNIGNALDDVLDPAKHFVTPFEIPSTWRVYRCMDWGSSKPFAVAWIARADGVTPVRLWGADRVLPRGSRVVISERYGWNGNANQGCRMLSSELAREIREREASAPWGRQVEPGAADSQIFAIDDGMAIIDKFRAEGVEFIPSTKGKGSRVARLEALRVALKNGLARPIEHPCWLAFETCAHLRRTLAILPRDSNRPDDVDTESEDHRFDMATYDLTTQIHESFVTGFHG